MKQMDRRQFTLLSGLSLLSLGSLAACSGQAEAPKEEAPAEKTETGSAQATDKRVIKDHGDNEVELPEKIEKVVITSITPLPSVYCMYRGGTTGLIGMSNSAMAAAKNSYLPNIYPEITDIRTDFYQGGKVNIEELVAMKPDVVLYRVNSEGEKELYEKAGLCAVGFSTTLGKFNCLDTFNGWLDLLRQLFPEEKNTKGVYEYGQEVYKKITEKTSQLKDEEKPKVLLLHQSANGILKCSGNTFFGQWWADTCGGYNVASDLKGVTEVSMEQIYQWNPDKIIINNFCSFLPEDLYENNLEGLDWRPVKAVQDKEVYKIPLGTYRWFPPSSDTPVALYWFAKTLQPELFKDIDMDKEVKDYFKTYYNFDLNDEELKKIYNPPREAAGNSWKKSDK